MGWATFAIEKLQRGETAQIRPSGHSMTGRVNHKDLVTLAPCNPDEIKVGDIASPSASSRAVGGSCCYC